MKYSPLKDMKFHHGAAAATAATSDIDTGVEDMSGFDGVMAIVNTGDVTASCVLRVTLFGNTASSTSSPTPVAVLTSTQLTAGASDTDSKLLVVACDKWDHTYRYVFARVERDDQNAVIDSVDLIQYNARSVPVTQADAILTAFSSN